MDHFSILGFSGFCRIWPEVHGSLFRLGAHITRVHVDQRRDRDWTWLHPPADEQRMVGRLLELRQRTFDLARVPEDDAVDDQTQRSKLVLLPLPVADVVARGSRRCRSGLLGIATA